MLEDTTSVIYQTWGIKGFMPILGGFSSDPTFLRKTSAQTGGAIAYDLYGCILKADRSRSFSVLQYPIA